MAMRSTTSHGSTATHGGPWIAGVRDHPELSATVNALALFGGGLVACGQFVVAGPTGADFVASWDGSRWDRLGSGMSDQAYALAVFGGELVTGGVFGSAGTVKASGIAAWNGHAWRELGGGVSAAEGLPSVGALALYQGRLIAGGTFTEAGEVSAGNIAAWDGLAWHAMGDGMAGPGVAVRALTVYGDDLIAAGQFTSAGGVAVNNIAAWNGKGWRPLGNGVLGSGPYGNTPVAALAVYNGMLIAGGSFTTAGGAPIQSIAQWDGSVWRPLANMPSSFGVVRSLAAFESDLIVGGTFLAFVGTQVSQNVIRWNGAAWTVMPGLSSNVRMLAEHNGELYAGGDWSGGINVLKGPMWATTGAWPELRTD
jgi:hypothetical protein